MLVLLEPMGDASNLDGLERTLGFQYSFHGGQINSKIWILCRDQILVDDIKWSSQVVTCKVSTNSGDTSICCSFVYALCRRSERFSLWTELVDIADANNLPWIVGGDFNIISKHSEKKGKKQVDDNAIMDFKNMSVRAGFSDASYVGNKYTWSNNRQGEERIWERIDRFLVNGTFISQFPGLKVSHLSRYLSDHCPLLVEMNQYRQTRSRFHYSKIWETHDNFKDMVAESWKGSLHANPLINFGLKIKKLRSILKRWNWEVFGDLRKKEKNLIEDTADIESRLQERWDEELSRQISKTKSELEDVLVLKECMTRDKARVSWLKEGDRNTRFFLAAINMRWNIKKISLLKQDGTRSDNLEEIGEEAVRFYSDLFNAYHPPRTDEDMENFSESISNEMNERLIRVPEEDEIFEALSGMNPDGSPGPDGFSVPFYLSCWEVIKEDFVKAVQSFFNGNQLPTLWTATSLSLLPKTKVTRNISDLA